MQQTDILYKLKNSLFTWRHFCCYSASLETVTFYGSSATDFSSSVFYHCSRFFPPPPRYCFHYWAPFSQSPSPSL